MVVAAVLFFVTQVMGAWNPSPGLKLEDCDWLEQRDQQEIETATKTLGRRLGDNSEYVGLGGGGAPTDKSTGEQASADDVKVWEMAVASGECPAPNSG